MTDAEVLLATADRLLTEVVPATTGLWPRTVALATRAALELELDAYWSRVRPEVGAAPIRAQLLLLTSYADADADADVARGATQAWHGLSRGSHHHAYELAPTAAELRDWLDTVRRLVARLR